jgi:hypothetical protein
MQATAREHSRWLAHLSAKYTRPRAELARLLAAPGALEQEIAQLISDAARTRAAELIEAREYPDDSSPELFERAVVGHYRRIRDARIAAAAPQIAMLRAQLAKDTPQ